VTVRDTIGDLPPVSNGEDTCDHCSTQELVIIYGIRTFSLHIDAASHIELNVWSSKYI
jgi:hypothetical protein